ncbi:MAG: tetratricopeptide repeat protein [Verrucomicrobiota bacterium]|nr:tetratricopeptide repeat protein [Verrucomicrobiota bacterium]
MGRVLRYPAAAPALALAAFCAAVWAQAIGFDFVWDDAYYIEHNEALRVPGRVADILASALAQKSMPPYPYRPLRTLHFAMLTWITRTPNPLLFHVANLIWHYAAALLLYALAFRLLAFPAPPRCHRGLAFLVAALFAVHPVASEVAPWAKSLDDIMATAFAMAAFLAAWNAWTGPADRRGFGLVLSVACFAAALYAKESVAGLFLLFLFPLALPSRPPWRQFAAWLTMHGAVLTIFLLTRTIVLRAVAQVPAPLSGTYGQTLLDMIPVAWRYLAVMLGIPPFLPDYSFMKGGYRVFSLSVIAGAFLIGLSVATLAWRLARRRQDACVWFGCAWLLLALLPVSNLAPMMQYFAVRFAYLPLVGFLLMAVGFLRGAAAGRTGWVVGVGFALVLLLGAEAFVEAGKWRDGPTLARFAFTHSPPSERIVGNYLVTLYNAGDFEEFERLHALYDASLARTDANVAWAQARNLRRKGQFKDALEKMESLRRAELRRYPNYLADLGVFYAEAGDYEEARACFERVISRWPSHVNAWHNLGMTLADLQKPREAVVALEQAVSLDPKNVRAWQGLLRCAAATRDGNLAGRALARLAELEPNNPRYRGVLQRR